MTLVVAFLAAVAFGTVWGWVVLISAFILITALVENEKSILAFFAIVIAFLALSSLHLQDILHYTVTHPRSVLLIIFGYFVAGTVWGIAKWSLYVNGRLEKYNEVKRIVLKSNKAEELTPEIASVLKEKLGYGFGIPQVQDHKGDILMWMTYWPFSCVWTLINDPVRKIFRSIYASISSSLQSISDHRFKKAISDLALAEQYQKEQKEKRGVPWGEGSRP